MNDIYHNYCCYVIVFVFKYHNIEFVWFLAVAGSARRTDFSWAYNRRSYSARVTAVLRNAEYSGGSVNGENFATKMRLNGHARRGGDGGTRRGGEKAREDRGEKEVVKDDEGRGISVSAARLHIEAATCWKAIACSLLLDRSRHPIAGCKDKQVSRASL